MLETVVRAANALSTLEQDDVSASALLVSELLPLLGAERAVAYGLSSLRNAPGSTSFMAMTTWATSFASSKPGPGV